MPGSSTPDTEAAVFASGPAYAPPDTPLAEGSAPTYPPLAIYIVYREYVHRNPGLTRLDPDDPRFNAYMERRLRQLYPDRGYSGMMRNARAEARRNQLAFVQTATSGSPIFTASSGCGDNSSVDPNEGADPSWTGQDEFLVPPDEMLPTLQMEIDSLQLVGTEVDNLYYYESLADGSYAPGGGGGGIGEGETDLIEPLSVGEQSPLDDLIRAAAAGLTPHQDEVVILVEPVIVGTVAVGLFAAWKYFRVQQAAERAVQRSGAYYPGLGYSNTQRDAHRHIYFSMMLRRYVGATAAKIITDRHDNNSSGPAKVMDLHNNDIGRSHRYHAFRGHWFWDRWDHGEWGLKVRNYVDAESSNGEFIPEWDVDPQPSTEAAAARRACVPVYKYVFFER